MPHSRNGDFREDAHVRGKSRKLRDKKEETTAGHLLFKIRGRIQFADPQSQDEIQSLAHLLLQSASFPARQKSRRDTQHTEHRLTRLNTN